MGKENISHTPKRRRKSRSVMGGRPRKIAKVPELVTSYSECIFCGCGASPELGNFFQDETSNMAAHQFCLFFSAGLPQNGKDSEGFDGFLFNDILKEKHRVNPINCKVCHRSGANSGCSVRACRQAYHFRCGREAGMQFNFSDAFNSYCKTHRSYQDLRPIKKLKLCPKCPVCLEELRVIDHDTIVRTPCCKLVFIHKQCVQEQAYASGYFFRCPTCNDTKKFPAEMVRYGIFTPLRDAAWEDNNAYSDLLEQYNKCDVTKCICRNGREYHTQSGKWHLLLCYVCGQSGVHVKCLGRRYIPGIGYVCVDCNAVVSLSKQTISTTQVQTDNRLREHKRLLKELTARSDPVLLASPAFAAPIWRKRFGVKPSYVLIEPVEYLLPKTKQTVISKRSEPVYLLPKTKQNVIRKGSLRRSCRLKPSSYRF